MTVEYERAMRRLGRRRSRHLVEQRRAEQAATRGHRASEPRRPDRRRPGA